MPKLVVRSFTISLDGFSAAPGQSQEAPFGKDGLRLMNWVFATKHFNAMYGRPGGVEGVDNDFMAQADANIGASIMGRHMFGPPPDAKDKGAMEGLVGRGSALPPPGLRKADTREESLHRHGWRHQLHLVNDGIESALKQAFAAANGKDVRSGWRRGDGAGSVLEGGLINELHLVQGAPLYGARRAHLRRPGRRGRPL